MLGACLKTHFFFEIALACLATDKAKTFFMLSSMAMGVFALTTVFVVSEVGKNMIAAEIQSFGVNRIWVFRDLNELSQESNPNPWTSNKMLDSETFESLTAYCPEVRFLAPSFRRPTNVIYNGKVFEGIFLIGAGSDWGMIHSERITRGRFIAPMDEERRNRVCILSQKAAETIFGEKNLLETNLQIGSEYFTVIGILENNDRPILESIQAIPAREETIIIPYTVMQEQGWYNTRNVQYLDFQATSFDKLAQTAADIKSNLFLQFGERARFEVKMLYGEIKRAKRIMQILATVLGILAGVAMLIAGLGITNIMLASVTERIHEIGIRKAVGATRKDVLFHFVAEAALVGALGGVMGILICLLAVFLASFWFDLAEVSLWLAIAISFSISVFTGMLAGVYPAMRAADLNPITALSRV